MACLSLSSRAITPRLRLAHKPARTRRTMVVVVRADAADEAEGCELPTIQTRSKNKPDSFIGLAVSHFSDEFGGIGQDLLTTFKDMTGQSKGLSRMPACLGLVLDDERVQEMDKSHVRDPDEPLAVRLVYGASVWGLDLLYVGRPIQRFWTLEVIARVPYFSYCAALQLYESLGWWQNTDLTKVHFAQSYGEQHHLMIMESLGGNGRWFDRFIAQHTAIFYYWAVFACYLISPKWSYYFMQLVEQHAADTYACFVENNREKLALFPAPVVAQEYYRDGDLYLFDEFAVDSVPGSRRPPVENLLQVFENIRDDELEHVNTMKRCQDYDWLQKQGISPHSAEHNPVRQDWNKWAEEINSSFSDEPKIGGKRKTALRED